MKLLTAIIASGMLAFGTVACAKEEPKAPVKSEVKTKEVCKDVIGKDGKPVKGKDGKVKQKCKTIKVHKKYEGTKVPEKK
jgi:hypothetical protein